MKLTSEQYEELIKKRPEERSQDFGDKFQNRVTGILIAYSQLYEMRNGWNDIITTKDAIREIKELIKDCGGSLDNLDNLRNKPFNEKVGFVGSEVLAMKIAQMKIDNPNCEVIIVDEKNVVNETFPFKAPLPLPEIHLKNVFLSDGKSARNKRREAERKSKKGKKH
jgi:hypothetical protein